METEVKNRTQIMWSTDMEVEETKIIHQLIRNEFQVAFSNIAVEIIDKHQRVIMILKNLIMSLK